MRYLAADVYYHGDKAGRLSREDGFYRFLYDREYVIGGGLPISFSLPVTTEPYDSEQLHGFFSGLVSEGWLKDLQSRAKKIDKNDELSLLIAGGQDLIGAVTLELPDLP